MKNFFKKSLFTLITLAFALVFVHLLLNNFLTKRAIKKILQEKIQQQSEYSLNFEYLHFRLLPISVYVYGIELSPQKNESKLAHIMTSRAVAEFSILNLLLGRAQFLELTIDNPFVFWKKEENETNKIPKSIKKQASALKFKLDKDNPLLSLKIHNGIIYFNSSVESATKSPEYQIMARDIDLNLKSVQSNFVKNMITIGKLNIFHEGRPLLVNGKIKSNMEINQKGIFGEVTKLDGDDIKIRGNFEALLEQGKQDFSYKGINVKSTLNVSSDLKILGYFLDLSNTSGNLVSDLELNIYENFLEDHASFFKINGVGQVKQGLLDNFKLLDIHLKYQIDKKGMSFNQVKLIEGSKNFGTISGYLGFDHEIDYRFMLNLDKMPLSKILDITQSKNDQFDFKMTSKNLYLSGTGKPFQMNLSGPLVLQNLALKNSKNKETKTTCNMDTAIFINSDELVLNHKNSGRCSYEESIKSPNVNKNKINLYGKIPFKAPIDLNINLQDFDLRTVSEIIDLKLTGHGDIALNFTEKQKKSMIQIKSSTQDTTVDDFDLGKVSSDLEIVDETLHFQKLDFLQERTTAKMQGLLNLKTSDIHLDLDILSLNAQYTKKLLTMAIPKAKISFDAKNIHSKIRGNTNNFFSSFQEISLDASRFKVREQRVLDSVSLKLTQDKKQYLLENCELKAFNQSLKCDGKILKKGKIHKNSDLLDKLGLSPKDPIEFRLESLETHKSPLHFGEQRKFPLMVDLDVDAYLSGTLEHIKGSGNIHAKKIKIKNKGSLSPVDIDILIDHSKIQANFQQKGGYLSARLDFDLMDHKTPFTLFTKAKQFDLRIFLPKPIFQDPRNFAYISGDILWKGYLEEFWEASGYLNIENIFSKIYYEEFGEKKVFDLYSANNYRFEIKKDKKHKKNYEPQALHLKNKDLNTKISLLNSKSPSSLEISLKGDAKLDLLSKIFTEIESASGLVQYDAKFFGPFNNLKIEASLKNKFIDDNNKYTQQAKIFIPKLSPQFNNLTLDLEYKNDTIYVHRLFSEKGSGFVEMAGKINLSKEQKSRKNKNTDLTIDLNQADFRFQIPFLKWVDTKINGNLLLSSKEKPYHLSGGLVFLDIIANSKIDFSKDIIAYAENQALKKSEFNLEKNPLLNFDINFNTDKGIHINNKWMKINASSVLRLTGNNENPIFTGKLSVDKGLLFYKRDFIIDRGSILFDEANKNIPYIDIKSHADVYPYRVFVDIYGLPKNVQVDLNIDPSTSPRGDTITSIDIFYLLTQGVIPERSNISQSQDLVGAGMSEAMTVFTNNQLQLDKLDDFLGQDFITIYPDWIVDKKGLPQPQLNASISLFEKIKALGQTSSKQSKISFNLPINNNIFFSGKYSIFTEGDNQNEQTIETIFDLNFGFSFK